MTFNLKLFAMLYMYAKRLRLPLAKMAKFPSKCRGFRRRILGEYYCFLSSNLCIWAAMDPMGSTGLRVAWFEPQL